MAKSVAEAAGEMLSENEATSKSSHKLRNLIILLVVVAIGVAVFKQLNSDDEPEPVDLSGRSGGSGG